MVQVRNAAILLILIATSGCVGPDPGARTPIGGEVPRDANGEPILAAVRRVQPMASQPVPATLAPLPATKRLSCRHLRRCD